MQCSRDTTASLIQECLQEATDFQAKAGEQYFRSVVVFEEIGLIELNPNFSLKVLHGLLDDVKVSFVGTSNWILDSSKMNRMVRGYRNIQLTPQAMCVPTTPK